MSVLGRDLGAAHFIVARKGKVRFMGQDDWITDYRKDAKPGVDDLDLPVMRTDLCTMPVKYDPNYRIQAIDASGVALRYEGLANFGNFIPPTTSVTQTRSMYYNDVPLILKILNLDIRRKSTLCNLAEFPGFAAIQ